MKQYAQMIRQLKTPNVMKQLNMLYGQREGMLVAQTTRYTQLIKRHEELVNTEGALRMISAPGRTEISGNHTDHNRGKVLAAAVNLDTLAAVTPRDDNRVCIHSEGYAPLNLSLDDLSVRKDEVGTTAALVRGVAARFTQLGYAVGGFDAVITSTVLSGSGLSSSAAFEVLVCAIFDELYNHNLLDAKTRAKISQYAENEYFGKPSGLMDQMASSVGGLVFIDFKEDDPLVKAISYDFSAKGYSLVVVSTGGSHDDLTDYYASIPQEMGAVAQLFGEKYLRMVSPEQFFLSLPNVRQSLRVENADRAILRAVHYFNENRRVADELCALQHDDLNEFLRLVNESGKSSFCYLQNIFATPNHQELSLALMLSEQRLAGKGAWRVHGGGFAGTTLNFVPKKQLASYTREIEAVFGQHSCKALDIRPIGPACITLGE